MQQTKWVAQLDRKIPPVTFYSGVEPDQVFLEITSGGRTMTLTLGEYQKLLACFGASPETPADPDELKSKLGLAIVATTAAMEDDGRWANDLATLLGARKYIRENAIPDLEDYPNEIVQSVVKDIVEAGTKPGAVSSEAGKHLIRNRLEYLVDERAAGDSGR